MLTAKDIMHKGSPALSFDTTIDEAIQFMRKNLYGFVAVLADNDRINGVLTEGNLMRIYLRYQTQKDKEGNCQKV